MYEHAMQRHLKMSPIRPASIVRPRVVALLLMAASATIAVLLIIALLSPSAAPSAAPLTSPIPMEKSP